MPHRSAASAYAKVTKSTAAPRSVEYQAFLQVNGRLMAAKRNPDTPFGELAEAVYQNSRLWTILAADVALEENPLPLPLKAQIISLALYSQKTGKAVLRGEADLSDLIDVNTAITNGLRGQTGTEDSMKGAA